MEIERGEAGALVTAPLSKEAVAASVSGFSGHTEYLTQRTASDLPVMLLATQSLRVALITTHLPLRAVSAAITEELFRTLRGVGLPLPFQRQQPILQLDAQLCFRRPRNIELQ